MNYSHCAKGSKPMRAIPLHQQMLRDKYLEGEFQTSYHVI